MFHFRSLLPNFNTPNDGTRGEGGVAAGADGNVAGAAGGEGDDEPRDLRRSVTTLLDAMQDLIRGLQLPGYYCSFLSARKMFSLELYHVCSG